MILVVFQHQFLCGVVFYNQQHDACVFYWFIYVLIFKFNTNVKQDEMRTSHYFYAPSFKFLR